MKKQKRVKRTIHLLNGDANPKPYLYRAKNGGGSFRVLDLSYPVPLDTLPTELRETAQKTPASREAVVLLQPTFDPTPIKGYRPVSHLPRSVFNKMVTRGDYIRVDRASNPPRIPARAAKERSY